MYKDLFSQVCWNFQNHSSCFAYINWKDELRKHCLPSDIIFDWNFKFMSQANNEMTCWITNLHMRLFCPNLILIGSIIIYRIIVLTNLQVVCMGLLYALYTSCVYYCKNKTKQKKNKTKKTTFISGLVNLQYSVWTYKIVIISDFVLFKFAHQS